jgi:hypothetical protein
MIYATKRRLKHIEDALAPKAEVLPPEITIRFVNPGGSVASTMYLGGGKPDYEIPGEAEVVPDVELAGLGETAESDAI